MHHLSSLDASFLHLETPMMPMHVGNLMLLDVPDGRRTGFLDELQRYMAARMQALPLFARKLETVAFGLADPVWVGEENVDLDYHVRSHTLAAPGGMRELERFVEAEHAKLMDRKRPLWELHLVDGMADGKLALYAKIHHAALAGLGTAALMQALSGDLPGAAAATQPQDAATPGMARLLAGSLAHTVSQAGAALRHLPEGLRAVASMRGRMPSPPPRTPFNASITAERSFTALQFPLEGVSQAAHAFGGSVHDALMAMVAGALRRFLDSGSGLPQRPLVAAVPVTVREREDGHLATRIALWPATLATDEEDTPARMRASVRHHQALRADIATLRPLMLTDFPAPGMPLLMGGASVLAGLAPVAGTLPPFASLVVSMAAGPAHAARVAGATVLASYPVSIVVHGLALNVTAHSCCGMLDVGIVAATSAVPDLQRFGACLRAAHAELIGAAGAAEKGAPRRPGRSGKPGAAAPSAHA